MSECAKCKLKKKDSLVGCEGSCRKWFHTSCINLSDNDFKLLDKCHNLFYLCDICKINCEVVNRTESKHFFSCLDNIEDNLNKFMSEEVLKKLADGVRNVLLEKMELSLTTLKNDLREIITSKLDDICTNLSVPTKNSEPSYASVTKPKSTVILKPKDSEQPLAVTRSDVLRTIDPINSAVNIANVKSARNGSLVINCENSQESDKFKELAATQLSEKYEIRQLSSLSPRIRVSNISEKFEEHTFLQYLRSQNKSCFHESSVCELIYFKQHRKNNKLFQAVLQVDIDTYHLILRVGKLNVGLDFDCPVYCAIEVRRCFKCWGFHHLSTRCSKRIVCPKCSDFHAKDDCQAQYFKCIHCTNLKNTFNVDIKTDHAAWDPECHVYLKTLNKVKANILGTQ